MNVGIIAVVFKTFTHVFACAIGCRPRTNDRSATSAVGVGYRRIFCRLRNWHTISITHNRLKCAADIRLCSCAAAITVEQRMWPRTIKRRVTPKAYSMRVAVNIRIMIITDMHNRNPHQNIAIRASKNGVCAIFFFRRIIRIKPIIHLSAIADKTLEIMRW